MRRRAFTPDQDKQLAAEYASGATYRELAAKYGGTDVSVRTAVRRAGQDSRRGAAAHGSLLAQGDPAAEAEALKLYEDGWSVRNLGKHFRCNSRTISELLKKHGAKLHPGGRDHPRFSSVEECKDVARRYEAGDGLAKLAKEYSCSTPVIAKAVQRGGGELRPPGRSHFWTQERTAWAVDEYVAGRSQQDIADELGISQGAVSNCLKRAGVLSRRPHMRGPNHHAWKGGRIKSAGGYVGVWPTEDDLLYATPYSNGYVPEHRLVMGRALGRKLSETETVHHIDGNPRHNALSNLQLRQGKHGKGVVMTCHSCGSHDVRATEIATPDD